MLNMRVLSRGEFQQYWQGSLCDYVNAIAWSPKGPILAASSATGEVVLWQDKNLTHLQTHQGHSVDCLAFSHDGQFLAASGQNGHIRLWQSQNGEFKPVKIRADSSVWIDRLAWSPTANHLAFNSGRDVQVWNAEANHLETTLEFKESSVMGIGWHPSGQHLALSGYQSIKVWPSQNWHANPTTLDVPSASLAIAWSSDGQYIASGNLDRTLLVWEWGIPYPWQMQGFTGKVRRLAWTVSLKQIGTPLLAACSGAEIVTWERVADPAVGWQSKSLNYHSATVQAIDFQPETILLSSASKDGRICLWQNAKRLAQILEGASKGFSCLVWHRQGHLLAAGGHQGELMIWSRGTRGQGFKKS